MKKLGLALGSGASRGAAHIGFLKGLEEEGIKPDFIAGCSMGSIVGAAYAAGVSIEGMRAAMNNLRMLDIITPASQRGGLFGTKKMRKTLEEYIGDIDFKDLKVPFHCIATDMCSRKIVEFSEGSVLDAIVASSCIPCLFSPFEKDGMLLVDGMILERVPVKQVKAMGADVVVAVDVLGGMEGLKECPMGWQMVMEVIMLMDEVRTQKQKHEYAELCDFWLEPELGDMSIFELKQIEFACEQGYALAKLHAKEIKKALED